MENIYLQIAGFNIRLNLFKTEVVELRDEFKKSLRDVFAGFILTTELGHTDCTIVFLDKRNIRLLKRDREYFMSFYKKISKNKIETSYNISIKQLQFIIKNILESFLKKGFILHASSALIKGKAYLFLGKPYAGKSTIVRLLRPEASSLADDSVIIKEENNRFFVYQTPFVEKGGKLDKDFKKYPLGRIFFLKKSAEFRLEEIKNKEIVLNLILNQFWSEKEYLKSQMHCLFKLIDKFSDFFYIYFSLDKNKLLCLLK